MAAHKALAELKGVANTIPNESILITTLSLQEAKASSEIENMVTTHDELFQSNISDHHFASLAAKEVHSYVDAFLHAVDLVKENGLLTVNHILQVQQRIEENNAGFRQQARIICLRMLIISFLLMSTKQTFSIYVRKTCIEKYTFVYVFF